MDQTRWYPSRADTIVIRNRTIKLTRPTLMRNELLCFSDAPSITIPGEGNGTTRRHPTSMHLVRALKHLLSSYVKANSCLNLPRPGFSLVPVTDRSRADNRGRCVD